MNDADFKPSPVVKVLFVWNGNPDSIRSADAFARKFDNVSVHAVYVTPHESIRAYTTVGYGAAEPTRLERSLLAEFDAAKQKSALLHRSKLEIVFGDRIHDVVRIAEVIKANYIVMPELVQSYFSKWLHGDLNERVRNEASCTVVFQESCQNFLRGMETLKRQSLSNQGSHRSAHEMQG